MWATPEKDASLRSRFWIGFSDTLSNLLQKSVGAQADAPFDHLTARKRSRFFGNLFAMMPHRAERTEVLSGPVPMEWMTIRGGAAQRTLLYVHGGSFILHRSDLHNALIARICEVAHARALIVDYRLAPEHPFPSGIEDVVVAYKWLLENQNVPASEIAIVADSAGGGLALSAMLEARDLGLELPGAMTFLGPWVDLTLSGRSMIENMDNEAMVSSLEGVHICSKLYLRDHPPGDPKASPLFADLHGMPPTLIHVGEPEILRDDGVRLSERMREADCDVWCDVYPHMPHVWHRIGPFIPESKRSIREIGDFLRTMIHPSQDQRGAVG